MQSDSYILVIGGTNMDIGARPFGPLLPHDSLPGTVRRTPGGVGRNIAVTLAQLGHKVKMLTAVGGANLLIGLLNVFSPTRLGWVNLLVSTLLMYALGRIHGKKESLEKERLLHE